MQSIDYKIKSRVYGSGRGSVFSPNDFLSLGSRHAVDKALSRLVAKGTLRRLARGLYDYPKTHPELGILLPSAETIANAVAGRHGIRLQPSGAYAANLLRLSEQVPMKVVFLTDGPSRKVKVGKQEIILKRTTPRNMATSGRTSGLVIQALRYLGKVHVTRDRVKHLRELLSAKDRQQLLKDLPLAPGWTHPLLRFIATDDESVRSL
jgi:hypothetical protein